MAVVRTGIIGVVGLVLVGCEELPEPTDHQHGVCIDRGYARAHCTGRAGGGGCGSFICGNLTVCRVDGGVTADGGVPCAETCDGRCGNYDSSKTCQCDDQCHVYGDCCPDLGALCGTCEERCGDYDSIEPCQCDSYCETADDCCLDIDHWCGTESMMMSVPATSATASGRRTARRQDRDWPPGPRSIQQ